MSETTRVRLIEDPELIFEAQLELCPVTLWVLLRLAGWHIDLEEVRNLPASPHPDDHLVVCEVVEETLLRIALGQVHEEIGEVPERGTIAFRKVDLSPFDNTALKKPH